MPIKRDILWVASRSTAIEQIQANVSDKYGVSVADILARHRSKRTLWARHVAIYLGYEKTGLSVTMIGKTFADRDHRTIMNSVNRVRDRIAADPAFASEVEELAKAIG